MDLVEEFPPPHFVCLLKAMSHSCWSDVQVHGLASELLDAFLFILPKYEHRFGVVAPRTARRPQNGVRTSFWGRRPMHCATTPKRSPYLGRIKRKSNSPSPVDSQHGSSAPAVEEFGDPYVNNFVFSKWDEKLLHQIQCKIQQHM